MLSQTNAIRRLINISMGFYLSSWFLPALTFNTYQGTSIMYGWECFIEGILLGWMELDFEAFATPLFLPAIFFLRRGNWLAATIFSGIALLLAAQTFTLKSIRGDGAMCDFASYEIGFYLWFSSFVIIFGISVWGLLQKRSTVSEANNESSVGTADNA